MEKRSPALRFDRRFPAEMELFSLFEATGWNQEYGLSRSEAHRALRASWRFVSVRERGLLVGFGRVISDGAIHALIVDLMVHPAFRGKGIGAAILRRLVAECKRRGVRDIQLFCAAGKAGFYRKHGFAERPPDAPGMQWRRESHRLSI